MKITIRNFTISLLTLCGMLCSFTATAAFDGRYLVTADMLTSLKESGLKDLVESTLDPEDGVHSAVTIDGGSSFTVKLSAPITLSEEKGGLVVMFGRAEGFGAPTATMVEGSNDGVNYDVIGYAYMQARGPKTIEYSEPLYVKGESKEYSFLHFTVLKTDKGIPGFSKFNLFMLKQGEKYPDGRIDPLRHGNDYDMETYRNYGFKPTKGILDSRNHYLVHDPNPWSGALRGFDDVNNDYPQNTPWSNWKGNTFVYDEKTYALPTFDMQDGNQMPHVTEHTVYAMPGDIVPLQPFYEMPFNYAYYVRFSHWYEYTPDKYNADGEAVPQRQSYSHIKDDKGNRLLDFLIDPYNIAVSEKSGYYAGAYLPLAEKPEIDGEGYLGLDGSMVISDINDFVEFSKLVEGGKHNAKAILVKDLDFEGIEPVTIGSSEHPFSGSFHGNGHTIKNMSLKDENQQPLGLFRVVGNKASISNLQLDNFYVENNGNTGILVGAFPEDWNSYFKMSIDNVIVNGDINVTGSEHAGGLVGEVGPNASINVKNAVYKGRFSGNGESAVLIGVCEQWSNSNFNFENCYAEVFFDRTVNEQAVIVGTSRGNWSLNLNNCSFQILEPSAFNDKLKAYKKQDGIDTSSGYVSSVEQRNRSGKKDGDLSRIYLEDNVYNDYVLILHKKDSNQDDEKIIYGVTDRETIEGKSYVYFESEYLTNDKYGYSIVPYIGDTELTENILNTNPEYFLPVCDIQWTPSYHQTDEFVEISTIDFATTLGNKWFFNSWGKDDSGYPIPPMVALDDLELEIALRSIDPKYFQRCGSHIDLMNWEGFTHRWYGTTATFYQPLDPTKSLEAKENLELQESVYHIAADFSHEFDKDKNVAEGESSIYSPIINFRHVFHVYDGKTFADQNTSSRDANKKYLESKRRVISAIAGKDFQVRLPSEFPVPTEKNEYPTTNFYYKVDDSHYAQARGFGIEVTNEDGSPVTDMFNFAEENIVISIGNCIYVDRVNNWENKEENYVISLQGTRKYEFNGPNYHTAGGEGLVHRMIECKGGVANEGTYTVRIYALDENRNPVMACDGSGKIYMMEYDITFIPDTDASFMINSDYEKTVGNDRDLKYNHTDAFLKDACGDPVTFLNFDEYKYFDDVNNFNQDDYFIFKKISRSQDSDGNPIDDYTLHKFAEDNTLTLKSFKWPTVWSQCSYSFGYGGFMNYDYNEYQIANHSSQVHFAVKANDYANNPDNTTGLYDRLYYDTKGEEKGYFYYVNAASDPGVTSRLQLDRLCIGSTVLVTAWVAEFSDNPEKANVAFNFSAVKEDGSRVRLHTFITGYIKNSGEWHHVYYSFVPELPENLSSGEVHHYELELENNCMSSQGADYAIDDIRMYIITPQISAEQLSPLCDAKEASTRIQLSTRFDKLLEAQGIPEATGDEGTECSLYVAIFDKNLYDELHATEGVYLEDIPKLTVIRQKVESSDDPVEFVKIPMNTNFSLLEDFNPNEPDKHDYTSMGYKTKGIEYLYANILPWDDDMKAGKQYYISFRLVDESVANNESESMDLDKLAVSKNDCAKYGEITLKGSGIVKVDGFAYNNGEPIEVCEGQSPVIQVELMKKSEDGEETISDESYYYDWYRGGVDDFVGSDAKLYDLLMDFRKQYPSATAIPNGDYDSRNAVFENLTPEEYSAEAVKYAGLAKAVTDNELILHQSSYVFPPIKSGDLYLDGTVVVTAIPIIENQYEDGELVCSQPNEIRLNIIKATPNMYDGFEEIEYPGMVDVPLRAGLRQLRDVSTTVTKIPDDFTRRLQVPLRDITSYKGENAAAQMRMRDKITGKDGKDKDVDPYVYIVETNDPVYKSLTAHPGSNLVDPGLRLHTDKTTGVLEGLLPVGMVTGLTADTKEKGNAKNAVNIVFTKDMQFREGYYYKLRFDFNEDLGEGDNAADVCAGQVVFTIKVVPEYQQWTGAQGRNWNNDANWRRVAKSELFLGDDDTEIGNAKVAVADHTKDGGNNDNTLSYAPMDFTKVIIPNDVDRFPLMFSREQKDVQILNNATRKWDEKAADADASNHTATKDIKYDMAAFTFADNSDNADNNLHCRPWYANTCEEIHFQYGAELQRQQHFICADNYQKAWVDLETEANRWYTLATPLQGVVAGDMYTISDGAKQNTELFRDITFNNDAYGRFEPAVYQRSWNRAGEAEIYSFEDKTNASSNAAEGISLNWSHVYNQVDVDYSGGVGFSINTRPNEDIDDNKVRFRLPKADTSYSYFTPDDKSDTADDKAISGRENRHKLNSIPMDVRLTAREESKYFLVGNPFIAQMDMAEFFKTNDNLTGKYWIMSGDRQMAYLWNGNDDSRFISTVDGETGATVAPMQGFFVEAKDAAEELKVKFTDDMIKVSDGGGAGQLRTPRPEGADLGLLRISALTGEDIASSAVINLSDEASQAYDNAEDAAMLLDSSQTVAAMVYTVASGKALAINSLDRIEQTEVGVVAPPEALTTLLFEGVGEEGDLKLLDTATGQFSDLYEGMEYEVEGSAAGRLYIVNSIDGPGMSDVAVVLDGRTVSVVSGTDGIVARAYDPLGIQLGEWTSGTPTLQFDLNPGIVLIEVVADGRKLTRKYVVK